MIPQDLVVLLPCHSLEDFPQHHHGPEADGLLAGWTALWHPALLAAAGKGPSWYRADEPPQELAERVLVVPSVSRELLPTGFLRRANEAGAIVLSDLHDRSKLVQELLQHCQLESKIDQDLAADFLALGYCFLQTQLLTRQMRYSSNLDELHFFDQAVAAAKLAVEGDLSAARDRLTACFDLLGEERDHYYSVDAYLLDLTLLVPQSLGAALCQQLTGPGITNVLLSGDLLRQMAESEPATLAALRQALEAGQVSVIGGEDQEEKLPLLAIEDLLLQLKQGQRTYEQQLQRKVDVFGRWRAGLTPALPGMLEKSGFRGAIHATFEEGRYPEGSQAKTRWEGWDRAVVDAVAKHPLDASRSETFLGLAQRLGESMDMDHVATLCLAHYPGQASPWYEDLQRSARFGAALGRLVTCETYFQETFAPGHVDRFQIDQYRTPYLRQEMIRQDSGLWEKEIAYWQRRAELDAANGLAMLRDALAGKVNPDDDTPDLQTQQPLEPLPTLDSLCGQVAESLPREGAEEADGILLLNPCSFPRRVTVDVSHWSAPPSAEKPVYAIGSIEQKTWAVADIPPMGFFWLTAAGTRGSSRQKEPLLAEPAGKSDSQLLLRNEYFEAAIDRQTGALRSVKDYASRTNRVAQQLGLRRASSVSRRQDEADENEPYTVMAARGVELRHASNLMAEVVAEGQLLTREGKAVADFTQTYRVWRGQRVIDLDVQINPLEPLTVHPWEEYVAARFAWPDETALLYRGVHGTRQSTDAKRMETPQFFEIESGGLRTSIFTSGLPYSRRVGFRKLDTLLQVAGPADGSSPRSFRLGIGVDVPNPAHEAVHRLLPVTQVRERAPTPAGAASGWLFHFDSRSVQVTHWERVAEAGRVVGARFRLLETTGKNLRTRLSCFRPMTAARRLDFQSQSQGDCPIEEGRALLEMGAHEWSEFEIRWD